MQERTVIWHGSALDDLRAFPPNARRRLGYQLERIQNRHEPNDWKSIRAIGKGVREIRVLAGGRAFRAIYVVVGDETVHILHVFEKKSRKTSKRDLELARTRLNLVNR